MWLICSCWSACCNTSGTTLHLPFMMTPSMTAMSSLNVQCGPMSCCCSPSNSSLNGFCIVYATHLGGASHGLLSGFWCKENIPSKHPLPLKMSSKSHWSCFVISALALLSLSWLGPERKYSMSLFFLPLVWMCYYYLNLNFCLCLYSNMHCFVFFYSSFPALCLYSTAHFLHHGYDTCLCCSSRLYLLFQCLMCCNL